jgi:hypothetical protein
MSAAAGVMDRRRFLTAALACASYSAVAGFASTGSAARANAVVVPLFGASGSDRSESGLSQSLVNLDASGQQQNFDFAPGVVVAPLLQDQLAAGPVAQARMDRLLPLGFHGCFIG